MSKSLLFLGGNRFRGGVEKEISGHLPRGKAGLLPRRARNGQSRTEPAAPGEFSELLASYGGGAGTGDRLPLVVYRVYPETGREEMIRGSRIIGLNSRVLRNVAGIGNDSFVYNYMQSQMNGFAGTALGPSARHNSACRPRWWRRRCLFEELEVRGARGEAKRLPLLPPPPMSATR